MKTSKWVPIAYFLAFASAAAAETLYTATPLGSLGGAMTSGFAINAAGQVTGESATPDGAIHAFVYSDGVMADLGTLPGSSDSHGYGINAAGQVTGSSGQQAFVYSNGVMTNLGAATTNGFGINNSGQITGYGITGIGLSQAFLYSNGVVTYIGNPLRIAVTLGQAINDSSEITGVSGSTRFQGDPFLYSNGVLTFISVGVGGAYGINSAGQITGDMGKGPVGSVTFPPGHAFLYSNGAVTDLGILPGTVESVGYGINDLAQVVGRSGLDSRCSPSCFRAFVYSNGMMFDLNSDLANSIGVTLTDARAINDSGQIVANGAGQAFLLTPVAVPEPSTVVLISAAGAVLFWKRKPMRIM